MTKKTDDPYLSELDSSLEDLDAFQVEEPTSIDTPATPEVVPELKGGRGPKEQTGGGTHPPLSREALDLSGDLAVSVVAVMGHKTVAVKDLLNLKMGQVVEFDRKPQDPIDLVVGGKVIAKGELVVVEGKLGIRLLQVI